MAKGGALLRRWASGPRGFESHSLRSSSAFRRNGCSGRMAERLKAHDWKSCGCKPAWVRIPLRPCVALSVPARVARSYGAWLSSVERCVRDAEVPGSNPGAPIVLREMTTWRRSPNW